MKTVLMFLVFLTTTAHAKDLLCSMSTINQVRDEVIQKPITDKNMHCSTSCILTLKCVSKDVVAIGIGKEILDMLTPGDDFDIKDIRADLRGVKLVTSGTARSKRDCYVRCKQYYPNRK